MRQSNFVSETHLKTGSLSICLNWMSLEEIWPPETISPDVSSAINQEIEGSVHEDEDKNSSVVNIEAEIRLKNLIERKIAEDPCLSLKKYFFDYTKEILEASEKYNEIHAVQGERVDAWAEDNENQSLNLFYFHVDTDSKHVTTEDFLNKIVSMISFFNGAKTGILKRKGKVYLETSEGELAEKIYRTYEAGKEKGSFFNLEIVVSSR